MTFEDQMAQAIQNKIMKEISAHEYTRVDYHGKKQIPDEVISKLWAAIDWDEVIEAVRPAIQTRICNTIVGAMETETKTDIKKLLAVEGVRAKLRMEVYPKLMQFLDEP